MLCPSLAGKLKRKSILGINISIFWMLQWLYCWIYCSHHLCQTPTQTHDSSYSCHPHQEDTSWPSPLVTLNSLPSVRCTCPKKPCRRCDSAHLCYSMAELKLSISCCRFCWSCLLNTFSAAVGLQGLPCESFMEQVHQASHTPVETSMKRQGILC